MVDFLGEVLGEGWEVVLHDVTNPERSVIAIRNSHVSGRDVGAPLTDFAVRKLVPDSGEPFFVNYRGLASSGRTLKSSTFFIRDEGRIVGMLCINRDTAALVDAIERIRSIFGLGYEDRERGEIEENFSNTVEGLLSSLLANAVKRFSIPPERMRQEEKLLFIKDLERQGFFTVKGAVNAAARVLNVSEPTVYRYLKSCQESTPAPAGNNGAAGNERAGGNYAAVDGIISHEKR